MNKRPFTVTINLVFILINALIWLGLGIIIALDVHPGLPDIPEMKGALAIISIAIASILILLTLLLFRHSRIAYYLTVIFFLTAAILTIFDDVGLADIVFIVICLIPAFLLIKDRTWYMQAKVNSETNLYETN